LSGESISNVISPKEKFVVSQDVLFDIVDRYYSLLQV